MLRFYEEIMNREILIFNPVGDFFSGNNHRVKFGRKFLCAVGHCWYLFCADGGNDEILFWLLDILVRQSEVMMSGW